MAYDERSGCGWTLLYLPAILLCLASTGSMARKEFAIYPEGLQEVASEYLADYERALGADDESGLAWLYATHGAEVETVDAGSVGAMEVSDWAHLLGHDPQAMGTAWGVSDAIMYAELEEAATGANELVILDAKQVTAAHGRLASILTMGMHDAVNDNLAEVEEFRQIAIPAAYEAMHATLRLLDVELGLGDELVYGVDYVSAWDGGDLNQIWEWIEAEREDVGSEVRYGYEGDPVGRQIFEFLVQRKGFESDAAIHAASNYAFRYTRGLSAYQMGLDSVE